MDLNTPKQFTQNRRSKKIFITPFTFYFISIAKVLFPERRLGTRLCNFIQFRYFSALIVINQTKDVKELSSLTSFIKPTIKLYKAPKFYGHDCRLPLHYWHLKKQSSICVSLRIKSIKNHLSKITEKVITWNKDFWNFAKPRIVLTS